MSKRIMFRFKKGYAIAAFLLFTIEVIIALFARDHFIRPYLGDFLVVMLIYCFLKSFWNEDAVMVALLVLLFACAVEISQYFNLIGLLGLRHSRLAILTMGKSFQWFDFLAYTLGIGLVIWIEKKRMSNT